jgi:hypothetical protein
MDRDISLKTIQFMNSWPMKMMTVPAGHRPVELTGRIFPPLKGEEM